MVTIPVHTTTPRQIEWKIPGRAEIREMMNHPGVAAAAIVAALLAVVTLVVCVTILALNDKSTDALIGAGAIAFMIGVAKVLKMVAEIRNNTRPNSD